MRGVVVSNTGPIIALAAISRLHILRVVFTEILVPEPVHEEILAGGAFGVGVSEYLSASWIRRRSLKEPVDPLMTSVLDSGEAAVIRLAREIDADWALIDERKARRIARNVYGLNVVGTVGLLVDAKRRGHVGSVAAELQKMRDAGYWIHDDIVVAAVAAAGEHFTLSRP